MCAGSSVPAPKGEDSEPAEHAALLEEIKSRGNIPRHVAIIMDGNGRWAGRRGLARIEGHRAGIEAVRRAVRAAGQPGRSPRA